jgi:hypothetical protein
MNCGQRIKKSPFNNNNLCTGLFTEGPSGVTKNRRKKRGILRLWSDLFTAKGSGLPRLVNKLVTRLHLNRLLRTSFEERLLSAAWKTDCSTESDLLAAKKGRFAFESLMWCITQDALIGRHARGP